MTRHDYRGDYRSFECVTLHRGHATPRRTWNALPFLAALAVVMAVLIVW